MMDFNVGELETVFDLGIHKILKKEDMKMIYSNDQIYFLKSSIYKILNEFTVAYIDHFIEKGIEFHLIKNRLNEIDEPFKSFLKERFGENLFLYNVDDVVHVVNGTDNFLKVIECLNNGINVNFG